MTTATRKIAEINMPTVIARIYWAGYFHSYNNDEHIPFEDIRKTMGGLLLTVDVPDIPQIKLGLEWLGCTPTDEGVLASDLGEWSARMMAPRTLIQ